MRPVPRRLVLLALVSVAAAGTWLAATAGHGYVYDDHRFVGANPALDAVAGGDPAAAFDPASASADGAEPGMWRPLRTLSFALDRALFGRAPAGMHLSSALLHGIATALVFALGTALGLGDLACAAGASAFAFHPVQAESVAWISSRGDLLAGSLVLLAVLLHLRRVHPALPLAAVALAFLAKESAAAAPLLFVAADLAAGGASRVRQRWGNAAAAAAVLGALAGLRAVVLSGAAASFGQGQGTGLGAVGALLVQPALFAWYAGRVLLPSPGTFDLQLDPGTGLALAGVALAVVLVSWERFRFPARAAGPARCAALWAVAALAPVTLLQVLLPLKILVADRFLYVALAGPALAAGAVAGSCGERTARALLVATPVLLVPTFLALPRWASDEALWRDTLAREERHPRALYGLAVARQDVDPEEARGLLRGYVDETPGDPGAWFVLGLLEERMGLAAEDKPSRAGHLAAAATALGEAERLWSSGVTEGRRRGFTEARLARACVLAFLGKKEAARAEALEGHRLWTAEPRERRDALAPRIEVLRRWASERDEPDLRRVLAGEVPATPPAESPK